MSLLRKKLTAKNTFPDVQVLETVSSKTSSWLNSVPFFRDAVAVYKNRLAVLQNFTRWATPNNEVPSTIRSCPGISTLFHNCVLVRWPTDYLIAWEDNKLSWNTPDKDLIQTSFHPQPQYKANNFNFTNFKVTLPVTITSNKLLNIVPLQPFYHNQQNLDVVVPPGVITTTPTVDFPLTINLLLPNTPKTYIFKKDDPLVYLYINEPFRLVNSNEKSRPYQRKKFFNDVKEKLDV